MVRVILSTPRAVTSGSPRGYLRQTRGDGKVFHIKKATLLVECRATPSGAVPGIVGTRLVPPARTSRDSTGLLFRRLQSDCIVSESPLYSSMAFRLQQNLDKNKYTMRLNVSPRAGYLNSLCRIWTAIIMGASRARHVGFVWKRKSGTGLPHLGLPLQQRFSSV